MARIVQAIKSRHWRLAIPLAAVAVVLAGSAAIAAVNPAGSKDSDSSPTQPTRSNNDTGGSAGQKNAGDKPRHTEEIRDEGDGSTTQVTINGESITVPRNGTYERSSDDGNARTQIKVDNRQQSHSTNGSSSNSSSSRIEVHTQSGTETESAP